MGLDQSRDSCFKDECTSDFDAPTGGHALLHTQVPHKMLSQLAEPFAASVAYSLS